MKKVKFVLEGPREGKDFKPRFASYAFVKGECEVTIQEDQIPALERSMAQYGAVNANPEKPEGEVATQAEASETNAKTDDVKSNGKINPGRKTARRV